MNGQVVIIVAFTLLIVACLELISLCLIGLFFYKRARSNPIDINIYELNKNGHSIRSEIGRFEMHPERGKCLYTCGLFPGSIKDNLGYNFSDNNLCISRNGYFGGRLFMAVAGKDKLFAPLDMTKVQKEKLKITPAEQKVFKSVCAQLMYPLDLLDNPKTLALTPIKTDMVRFSLDTAKDKQDLHGNKDKEFAKTLIKYAVVIFIAALLVIMILLIVMITQGPDMVQSIATTNAQAMLPPG